MSSLPFFASSSSPSSSNVLLGNVNMEEQEVKDNDNIKMEDYKVNENDNHDNDNDNNNKDDDDDVKSSSTMLLESIKMEEQEVNDNENIKMEDQKVNGNDGNGNDDNNNNDVKSSSNMLESEKMEEQEVKDNKSIKMEDQKVNDNDGNGNDDNYDDDVKSSSIMLLESIKMEEQEVNDNEHIKIKDDDADVKDYAKGIECNIQNQKDNDVTATATEAMIKKEEEAVEVAEPVTSSTASATAVTSKRTRSSFPSITLLPWDFNLTTPTTPPTTREDESIHDESNKYNYNYNFEYNDKDILSNVSSSIVPTTVTSSNSSNSNGNSMNKNSSGNNKNRIVAIMRKYKDNNNKTTNNNWTETLVYWYNDFTGVTTIQHHDSASTSNNNNSNKNKKSNKNNTVLSWGATDNQQPPPITYEDTNRTYTNTNINDNSTHNYNDKFQPIIINLRRGGGKIEIHPNLLPREQCIDIKQELLSSGLFRRYQIQNSDEPRAHFLLHQDATDYNYDNYEVHCDGDDDDGDFTQNENGNDNNDNNNNCNDNNDNNDNNINNDNNSNKSTDSSCTTNKDQEKDILDDETIPQPGYHYSNVTLKARPLSRLPLVEELSEFTANYCNIPNKKWTIGVNPVLYRDGKDKMGDHADDDQGEEIILAVIIDAPENMITTGTTTTNNNNASTNTTTTTTTTTTALGKKQGGRQRRAAKSNNDAINRIRRIKIHPFKRLPQEDGDEFIELFLRPGDAYEMNGDMQKHYAHSVPPDSVKETSNNNNNQTNSNNDINNNENNPNNNNSDNNVDCENANNISNHFDDSGANESRNETTSTTIVDGSIVTTSTVSKDNVDADDDDDDDDNNGDASTLTSASTRIVIVFRTGECKYYYKDTGRKCVNLRPDVKPPITFGHLPWLQEGHIYPRTVLINKGGHLGIQRGISGNKKVGCNAIIVSGLRPDQKGNDEFTTLGYAVERSKGAEAVVKSTQIGHPIRIFRSSTYKHDYGATMLAPSCNDNNNNNQQQQQQLSEEECLSYTTKSSYKRAMYRYDGLYHVVKHEIPEDAKNNPYFFDMERSDPLNTIKNECYIKYCQELGTMSRDITTTIAVVPATITSTNTDDISFDVQNSFMFPALVHTEKKRKWTTKTNKQDSQHGVEDEDDEFKPGFIMQTQTTRSGRVVKLNKKYADAAIYKKRQNTQHGDDNNDDDDDAKGKDKAATITLSNSANIASEGKENKPRFVKRFRTARSGRVIKPNPRYDPSEFYFSDSRINNDASCTMDNTGCYWPTFPFKLHED